MSDLDDFAAAAKRMASAGWSLEDFRGLGAAARRAEASISSLGDALPRFDPTEQVRRDWDAIVADWVQRVEAGMDAAFKANNGAQYRALADLRDAMRSARRIMDESGD